VADQAPVAWSENSVLDRLTYLFPETSHVILRGVRNATGFPRQVRTADALVLSTWPSRGLWMAGVEVKISKSDYRKELEDPTKAHEFHRFCHFWYVATPKGLLDGLVIPETWGHIEVQKDRAKVVKTPIQQTPIPITMAFLCSILRQVSEGYISKETLNTRIAEEAERQNKRLKEHLEYEYKKLKENVEHFENLSGVKLAKSWELCNIGPAVRFVVNSGLLRGESMMERLLESCERSAKDIREALEEFRKASPENHSVGGANGPDQG